jgi:hypothetical protein
LIVILAVISIMVIDSTIVKFIAFSNKELAPPTYVGIFVIFTILFVGTAIVLLAFVKSKEPGTGLNRGLRVKISYLIIALTQFSLIGIMVLVIQQTIALKSYSILLLFAAVYISHITAFFFLILLLLTFLEWIRTKPNTIVSLYTISFALTAIAIMTSMIYATNVLSYQPQNIRPFPIHMSLISLPRSDLANSFGITLDIISILSFVSVWVASAALLSTYSRRIGKIKYWTIVAIPLIYFLFPFEGYFLNTFQPLVVSSPILYGVVNVLVFSATKQIGALFFSLAFLAASTLVAKGVLQKYLLISAIGMATLFGSIEIDTLLYATYLPFGLVTISFMPIGSYLLFTGIVLSARLVARDKELRKEFYNTAVSQLDLLKTIGVTQMENELMKIHKSVDRRKSSLQIKEPHINKGNVREALDEILNEMDQDNVREILHDVLTDVYSNTRRKSEKS